MLYALIVVLNNITCWHNVGRQALKREVIGSSNRKSDALPLSHRGGLVVGRRTCDLVVAGSRPGRNAAA